MFFVAVINPLDGCPLVADWDVPAFAAALGVCPVLQGAIALCDRPKAVLLAAAPPGSEWCPDDCYEWIPGAVWGETLMSEDGVDLCRVLVQRFAAEEV